MEEGNKYPNAWDFSNADKETLSPNGKYRIEYSDLGEFAMGSPIGGECYLIVEGQDRYLIDDHCGGPPVWSPSNKVALGRWHGRGIQQILILDPQELEVTIYTELFTIVNLRSFEGELVKGIESPIYHPEDVLFDTSIARVECKRRIEIVASSA